MSSENTAPITSTGDDEELKNPLGAREARPIAAPVGAAATRGFYWLTALSLATKFLSTGTQIVLSWFVGRTEFGLVGTTTTIASFVWILQDAGLSQILIKRQRRFTLWCTPIFWLSMALAVVAALLTGTSGFVAAHIMHQRALVWLLILMAIRGFVSAPSTVPGAQLNKNMQFGLVAAIGLAMVTLERGLMVLFTSPLVRWGAFGFIVAMLIVSAIRTVIMWWYARPPVKMKLEVQRWKFVYRDSWLLTVALTFQTITLYGDNLLLALFRPQEVVGDYFWTFNLSMQTITLLTSNVGGVLFPALSRLQKEPERMRQGFIRAARMLTLLGVPGCLLQAALARPLVVIVFRDRWLTAVPALQVLSLGMAMLLVNYPAIGLLRAQGRFSAERTLSGVCAGLFLVAALLGAMLGGSLSMAIAVSIYNAVAGILFLRIAIGPDWRKIVLIFFPPAILSCICIGCGYTLGRVLTNDSRAGSIEQVGIIICVGMPLYAIAVRTLMPDMWREMTMQLDPLWRKARRLFAAS